MGWSEVITLGYSVLTSPARKVLDLLPSLIAERLTHFGLTIFSKSFPSSYTCMPAYSLAFKVYNIFLNHINILSMPVILIYTLLVNETEFTG